MGSTDNPPPNEYAHNTCDGTDSTLHFSCHYGEFFNIHHSTYRSVCNGVVGVGHIFHDNLQENLNDSGYCGHVNCFEYKRGYDADQGYGGSLVYNNIVRNSVMAECILTCPVIGSTDCYYNNGVYNLSHEPWVLQPKAVNNNCENGTVYFINNTFADWNGNGVANYGTSTGYYINNHWINITDPGWTGSYTETYKVYQETSTANGQGYTSGNAHRPTKATGATVDTGSDQHTALSCTNGSTCIDILRVPRPQGSAWDIGAYEYISGGGTTPPAAPTGLSVN